MTIRPIVDAHTFSQAWQPRRVKRAGGLPRLQNLPEVTDSTWTGITPRVNMKRKRADQGSEQLPKDNAQLSPEPAFEDLGTPSKRRSTLVNGVGSTPTKPRKSDLSGLTPTKGTPTSKRKVLFSTPNKHSGETAREDGDEAITPTIVRNADRSARRKSNRRFLEKTLEEGLDDDDDMQEEEDELAQRILEEEDADEAGAEPVGLATEEQASTIPETPVKRGRGRPKGSTKKKKERSPTPPLEMPPHEKYFWQNKPGGNKTSNNTVGTGALLNHEEYFNAMKDFKDRHATEKQFLLKLHARSFEQWIFELEQAFNVCLYGYGSKRPLTEQFTKQLHTHLLGAGATKPKIVVVNGFHKGITIRDILNTVASAVLTGDLATTKLPAQPHALCAHILSYLAENPPTHPVYIILNSIDALALRRVPAPALIAQLAASPSISLLATADTPNFPLLWDLRQRAQLRFVFHDATTFAPYTAEFDAVDDVNTLLGRSGRRIAGKDGVAWVLRSLPENARSLFRILVAEQLAEMDENNSVSTAGVEYRVLYHKAVEEFVCSSEVGFRTLLKEFHDHQMIESRKDAIGTERLVVPFPKDELEGLLEDLTGDML